MLTLCEDVISEILKYTSVRDMASLYSVNQSLFHLSKSNKVMKERKILSNELDKTKGGKRKYYNSKILDLQFGQRVTDHVKNYRVCNTGKKACLLEEVDMLGNKIDDVPPEEAQSSDNFIITRLYTVKRGDPNYAHLKHKSFWSTIITDGITAVLNRLKYGIIKHECGPYIKHVDSIYLNYITLPKYLIYHVDEYLPQVNMLIIVNYKFEIYEYVITELKEDYFWAQLLPGQMKERMDWWLQVHRYGKKWYIKNVKYKLIQIGGYKY